MRIISWNINGLRARMNDGSLMDVIDDPEISIVCLQETRVATEMWAGRIPGYEEYLVPSDKPGYAGVGLYTRIDPEIVYSGMGTKEQGRIISAIFREFIIVNVYAPVFVALEESIEGHEQWLSWYARFGAFLNQVRLTKPIIVCGDLNVTPSNWKYVADTMPDLYDVGKGFETASLYGNKRIANVTWHPYYSPKGLRLDYFLVDPNLIDQIVDYDVLDVKGSDHQPIIIEMETK